MRIEYCVMEWHNVDAPEATDEFRFKTAFGRQRLLVCEPCAEKIRRSENLAGYEYVGKLTTRCERDGHAIRNLRTDPTCSACGLTGEALLIASGWKRPDGSWTPTDG
jgi:ribosomal protein L37E